MVKRESGQGRGMLSRTMQNAVPSDAVRVAAFGMVARS